MCDPAPALADVLVMHTVSAEWVTVIGAWLVALRAAGRPETTLGLRDYQLRRVAVELAPTGPWEVTGAQLVEWAGAQAWARETRRSYRSALRGFYGWAHGSGLLEADPSRALPSVKPTPPNPRPAPEDAYRLALARADDRVRLMLRLAAELGMRRGEVARCHVRDLERDLAGWSLVVHGKGGRVRRLPLTDALAAAIRRHGERVGGGFLFPGDLDGHLSPAWVGRLVSRAMPEAWAMHSLRHRFATVAYAVDRDLLTVQELLGHASPVTTRLYVRVPADAARRTVQLIGASAQ